MRLPYALSLGRGYPVQCRHVERCRGGSLLDGATDMESVRIRRSMDDLMDRTWESVKSEDHIDRFGEELGELRLAHAVRMIFGRINPPPAIDEQGWLSSWWLKLGRRAWSWSAQTGCSLS